MSKRKLNKTKTTTSRTKPTTRHKTGTKAASAGMRFKKPLLVGVVLALFGGPASWMLVSAQSDTGDLGSATAAAHTGALDQAGKQTAGQSAQKSGGTNGQAASGNKTAAKDAKSTKNSKDSKDAKQDQTKGQAAGQTGSAAGGSKSNPTPGPSPVAAKPAPAPAPTPPPAPYMGVHDNITSTIFWIGEPADADNANITNTVSAWDEAWQAHYGGVDDPNSRNGYAPAAFAPLQNPFYFALPYNDFDDAGRHKASAANCPNAAALASRRGESWCKNSWIKITHGGKTTYAQWEDVGPLQEDDTAYVFGTARPKNTWGAKAGLDVSPAVRDYLGLRDVDTVSWIFVDAGSVPAGPWKQVVTSAGVYWL